MEIIGNIIKKHRIITGLHSFDRAFINRQGDIGFVLGSAIELYGATHCGKSTIAYSLSGMLANKLSANIALADFEGLDIEFLETVMKSTGFDNKLYFIAEKNDETTLQKLANLIDKNVNIGILDSIGAISPISEVDGDLGESNMGRRAFLMAQFSRKMISILRDSPNKSLFMINHAYPKIGGRGMETPGGEVKKYLSSIRISVKRKFFKGKYEEFPDGSYIIQGTVVKNRWGLKEKEFELFVLSGYGIHPGLTAMQDAVNLGLVERSRTIKVNGVSLGYLKDVVEQAHAGNDEFFSPFYELLANAEVPEESEKDADEFEDTTEDRDTSGEGDGNED
jgi:recombination protein RecA